MKQKKVNDALFRPSEWDDYPMKRDEKHINKVIQPDFAPLTDASRPEPLPSGYTFGSLDINDDVSANKLCVFLNANYEGPFEFEVKYLRWVLNGVSFVNGNGRIGSIIVCVTAPAAASARLVGVVCARPIVYRVDGRVIQTLEVGWLCTLAELRGKRLASMLMKEMYRRAHQSQLDCGMIFGMTRQLPSLPLVNETKVLYRSLEGETPIEATKNIDLIRFANMRDISRMMKIYRNYATLKVGKSAEAGATITETRWRLHREFTRREFEHVFLRRGDVSTYVIRTDRGDVKDFVSMSTLNLDSKAEPKQKIAYIHFISYVNDKLLELFMQNVLYILSRNGFAGAYIEDVNGVGEVCRSKLGFHEKYSKWYYQFNYNTKSISLDQTQFSSFF